jgi:TRAP-type mannitol/chloroaromatic compound transport system permease large subunit
MVPVISPVAAEVGFDPVWFAIMVCINLNVAFMTPPMAGGIFLCKGAADPKFGINIADIIRGVLPFVAIVLFALVIFALYPSIITWLPQQMIR